MKEYIVPCSAKLSLNLNENIARSAGITRLYVTWDMSTGLVINTDGIAYKDPNRTQLVLNWLREHSQDTSTFECI